MDNNQYNNTQATSRDRVNGTLPAIDFDTAIISTLPVAIYTCDSTGRISFYNHAAAELWGRSPETSNYWCGSWKLYSIDGNLLSAEKYPMAITLHEKRNVPPCEVIMERPNGDRRIVLCQPKLIFDNDGVITGAVNMLTDVTEAKQAAQDLYDKDVSYQSLSEMLDKKVDERTLTLKESEERYHKMIDEVQDYAILLLDIDGNIQNWNRGAENIKGYTEAEIIGKNFRIFYRAKDRQEKLPEKLIREAYDKGRAMHEGWRVRKDGTEFWGSIVITALHNDDNKIIGFSKVTRDLTERKLAEDQVNNYMRDIEFRNKQLEEYAYIASHDLQEPLRKIQIFCELLEGNIGNEEAARKNVDKINASARRMSSLIKDVLKYSQLSIADELYIATDLNKVLETVKEDYELLIEQKNVTILQDQLPVIMGIPIQLHQLFSNLLSNSIKFSTLDPVITITAQHLTIGELQEYPDLIGARPYIKLTFKDNGVGFEQQYGDQVFKMFKRLSENAGTGIGLALCKKIVENHNGYINVVSQPGMGTAFTIILPLSSEKSSN
jgi:PAS domain S-box-containing protein